MSSTVTSTTHSTVTSASSSPSTTTACAACKYQRRKCNPDCPLAPYFPADRQRQFLNAHRLFGVSNILKITRGLDPERRSAAMRSIIFQSNARAHDPVGGCFRIIQDLERQLDHDSAELALVLRHLAFCRAQSQPHMAHDTTFVDGESAANIPIIYDDNLQQQQQQELYDYFYYGGGDEDDNNHNISISMSNSNSVHSNNNNNNSNGNEVGMEMPMSMLSLQQNCMIEEVDEEKPLMDMFEMRQSLAIEEDVEDSKHHVAEAGDGFDCKYR